MDQVALRAESLTNGFRSRLQAARDIYGTQAMTHRRTSHLGDDVELSRSRIEARNGQRGRTTQTSLASPTIATARENGLSRRIRSAAGQAGSSPSKLFEASTADAQVGTRRDTRSFGRFPTVPPSVEPLSPPYLRLEGSVAGPSISSRLRVEPWSLRTLRSAGLIPEPYNSRSSAMPSTSSPSRGVRSTVRLTVQPHCSPGMRLADSVVVSHNSGSSVMPLTPPSTIESRVSLAVEQSLLPDTRSDGSVSVPRNVRSSPGPFISVSNSPTSEPAVSSTAGQLEHGEMSARFFASRDPSPVNQQDVLTKESGADYSSQTGVEPDYHESSEGNKVDSSREGEFSNGRGVHSNVHVRKVSSEMFEEKNRTGIGEESAMSETIGRRGAVVWLDRPASPIVSGLIEEARTEQEPNDSFTAGYEEKLLSRERLQNIRGLPGGRADIETKLTGLETESDPPELDATHESSEHSGNDSPEAAVDGTTISQVRLRAMATDEQREEDSIQERAENGPRRTEPERMRSSSGLGSNSESRGRPGSDAPSRADELRARISEIESRVSDIRQHAFANLEGIMSREENGARRSVPERSATLELNVARERRGHPDRSHASTSDALEGAIDETINTISRSRLGLDDSTTRIENPTRRTSAMSGSTSSLDSRGPPVRNYASRADGVETTIDAMERTISRSRRQIDNIRARVDMLRRTGHEGTSATPGLNVTQESRVRPDVGDDSSVNAAVDGRSTISQATQRRMAIIEQRVQNAVRERVGNGARRIGLERSATLRLNVTQESRRRPDRGEASWANAVVDEGATISQATLRRMARIEQRVQNALRESVDNGTRRIEPERMSNTSELDVSESQGLLGGDETPGEDELDTAGALIYPEQARLTLEIANLRYQQQRCLSRFFRLQQEQIRTRQRQVSILSNIVNSFGRTVEVARILGQGENSSFGRIRSHFLSTLRRTLSFLSATLPASSSSTSTQTDSGLLIAASSLGPNAGSFSSTHFGAAESTQDNVDGMRAVLRYVEVDRGLIDVALRTLLRLANVASAMLSSQSLQERRENLGEFGTDVDGLGDAIRRCSAHTIASLPDVPQSESNALGEGCVICLSGEITTERTLCALPCKHVFHRDCVSRWLSIQASCPTCRAYVPDVDAGSTQADVTVSAP